MSEFNIKPSQIDAFCVHTPFLMDVNGKSVMFFAGSENYDRQIPSHIRNYDIYVKFEGRDPQQIIHHGVSSCSPWVTKLADGSYRLFMSSVKCQHCGATVVSFKSRNLVNWVFEDTVLKSFRSEIICPCIVETKNGTKMYYTASYIKDDVEKNVTMICDLVNLVDTVAVANHRKVILKDTKSAVRSEKGYMKPNVFPRDDHLIMMLSAIDARNMYVTEFFKSDDGLTWDLMQYDLSHLNKSRAPVNQFYKPFVHRDRLYYVDKLVDASSSITSIPFDINAIQ